MRQYCVVSCILRLVHDFPYLAYIILCVPIENSYLFPRIFYFYISSRNVLFGHVVKRE